VETQEITVTPVDFVTAGKAMRDAGLAAPLACDTPESIAYGGDCFEMVNPDGKTTFVLRRKDDILWIDGAGSVQGEHQVHHGLHLAKEIGQQCGCKEVAFETARRGLVRQAARHGFEVVGFILKAKI